MSIESAIESLKTLEVGQTLLVGKNVEDYIEANPNDLHGVVIEIKRHTDGRALIIRKQD